MEREILTAEPGKIFAYKDEKDEEIRMGNILYLGVNDNGSRYYQVDEIQEPEVV